MEALLLLALSILTACQDWGVTLPADPLAERSGSCVTIPCSYTYPEGQLVRAVTWSQNKERIVELTAAAGQGYGKAERVQFLGDLQHNCTVRLNPLALGDRGAYSFEFQTQSQSWRSPRALCLTVSGLDQFYFWVHNYEDLPRGPSLQFEQGTTLSYGGNYTCTEWVSGTRLGYLAISPTTYVAILDSIDWYQLSPGPMAGFGAGVLLLFLLSNLRV
ncbi:B-cell receptor CD22 [Chelonia mydas]|uniref:B-cell receptor CD22 n=1 Tax=Chelonia mydas TaxID=8469 RepID=M7BNW4_CHEMY|nr:B-cell receptor CD22 [Chelonia mydas]